MGNWRTVQINGRVNDKQEVREARKFLTVDRNYECLAHEENVYYLSFSNGLCSINQWINNDGTINTTGNLYERDCSIDELEEELIILANKYPSMDFILHAGDDYENINCVASFIVKNGTVKKYEPMIEELKEIDPKMIETNFIKQLRNF